jgi:hypothetical protein
MIFKQAVIVQLTKQFTSGLNVREMISAGTCRVRRTVLAGPGFDVILDYEADRARRIASNIIYKDVRQLTTAELIIAG